MVDEEGAGDGRLGGGVEGAFEGGEKTCNVTIKIAQFAGYGADHFGLVGWEVNEGLGAFGMLDLWHLVFGERNRGIDETYQFVTEFTIHGDGY